MPDSLLKHFTVEQNITESNELILQLKQRIFELENQINDLHSKIGEFERYNELKSDYFAIRHELEKIGIGTRTHPNGKITISYGHSTVLFQLRALAELANTVTVTCKNCGKEKSYANHQAITSFIKTIPCNACNSYNTWTVKLLKANDRDNLLKHFINSSKTARSLDPASRCEAEQTNKETNNHV